MPAINDYSIKLGWDAKAVNAGITSLEKRINKLAITAQKLDAIGTPRATAPRASRMPAVDNAVMLADRKITLLDETRNKMRALQRTLNNIDLKAKGGQEAANQIRTQIDLLGAYQRRLEGTTFTTKAQLVAQRGEWKALKSSVSDVQAEVVNAGKAVGFFRGTVKRAAASFKSATATFIGAYAVLGGVRALYDNGKAWENLGIQMQASFGGAEQGAAQMEYLIGLSQKLGVDVTALADGYAKIGVAGRMSNMPLAESKEIFLAASEASRAFGLSTDDTQGVMRAFSQMMGKGQVMMEELKLQLGDRMPSAMGLFAKSMGKTVPEFMKLVEEGKVGNKELLGFARTLRADIRETGAYEKSLQSVEAAQSRFNTALKLAGDRFFKGALQEGIAKFFNMFGTFMSETEHFWEMFGDVLGWVTKAGLGLLKVVLIPIQQALKGIGLMYKAIKDTTFVDKKDMDNMSTLGKTVRFISGLFVDIARIVWWVGKNINEAFTLDTETWDKLFNAVDRIIDIDGVANRKVEAQQTAGSKKLFNKNSTAGLSASQKMAASIQGGSGGFLGGGNTVSIENKIIVPKGTTEQQATAITKEVKKQLGAAVTGAIPAEKVNN